MLTELLISKGIFISGWAEFLLSFTSSFLIIFFLGKPFINIMRHWQKKGQPISENVPVIHQEKSGTPTMGGLLIIFSVIISSLLFMPFNYISGYIALFSLIMFGIIGFFDDYKKIKSQSKKASNGLSARLRLLCEAFVVIVVVYLINKVIPAGIPSYTILFPFGFNIFIGYFYYLFAYFVIAGSANATNITDGLDGMLCKLYIPTLIVLIVVLYITTRVGFIDSIILIPKASGLYPVMGAVFGAVLGFLWFNSKPASIFMGDVGSLALGGFMGTVSMLLKMEFIMGISAFMMVIILASSFIQTMYFKITRKLTGEGKRIFKMAPLHHHFELKGWSETKIVERFFIISILFSGFALILLKFF